MLLVTVKIVITRILWQWQGTLQTAWVDGWVCPQDLFIHLLQSRLPVRFLCANVCSCSRTFYPVHSAPGLWKSISCPRRVLTVMGWTYNNPRRSLPLQDASLWCFVLSGIAPLASTISGYIIQALGGSGLLPPTGLGNFRGLSPLRGTSK
jgi:hypothetical protein